MIKQFETALATGQNLDLVRDELKRQADGVRLARYADIDRSYHCCQLILFGITEPAGSVAGGIARGYVKQCKKAYLATKEGKEHQKLIRALKKAEDEPITKKKKGKVRTDDTANKPEHEEGKQDDATSEEGNQQHDKQGRNGKRNQPRAQRVSDGRRIHIVKHHAEEEHFEDHGVHVL